MEHGICIDVKLFPTHDDIRTAAAVVHRYMKPTPVRVRVQTPKAFRLSCTNKASRIPAPGGSRRLKSHLRPGDIIQALDGRQVKSFESFRRQLRPRAALGDPVVLRIRRGDMIFDCEVELE